MANKFNEQREGIEYKRHDILSIDVSKNVEIARALCENCFNDYKNLEIYFNKLESMFASYSYYINNNKIKEDLKKIRDLINSSSYRTAVRSFDVMKQNKKDEFKIFYNTIYYKLNDVLSSMVTSFANHDILPPVIERQNRDQSKALLNTRY